MVHPYIFTCDVEALYTNINLHKIMVLVKRLTSSFYSTGMVNFILRLLSICLYRNDFCFNKNIYLQTKGIAMGASFAPILANLYMYNWQNDLFSNYKGKKPTMFIRYIDDCFGIFEGNYHDLNQFMSAAKNFDVDIKLTFDTDVSYIHFLDVYVYIFYHCGYFKMGYGTFFKPTTPSGILHYNSYTSRNTKIGVVKSQIVRILRRSLTYHDFSLAYYTFSNSLKSQSYNKSFIKHVKRQLLNSFNLDFNPSDFIIPNGFYPCNSCRICKFSFSNDNYIYNNVSYIPLGNFNCNTSNIVYAIVCKRCSKVYVGQTMHNARRRIQQHLNCIRNINVSYPIYNHFLCNNHTIDDFSFTILAHNPLWTTKKRLTVENTMIKRFNSFVPYGLNIQQSHKRNPILSIPYGTHLSSHTRAILHNTTVVNTNAKPLSVCLQRNRHDL